MAVDIEARDLAAAARGTSQLGASQPYIGIIGDSIAAPDYNGSDKVTPSTPTNALKSANGIASWALALCGQRVLCPASTNIWAYPGQETGTILANLPAFLAQMPVRPGAIIIECGTNNISHNGATGTFAAITTDWAAIADYLAGRGIRTIFIPILPRGAGFTTLFTAAQFDVMERCNRWLNAFAAQAGRMVAVASACLPWITAPDQVGAQPRPNFTIDGTHPGVTGAYYIGKAIAQILNLWYPPLDILATNGQIWSASAPYSNLLANPMMQGGGGTVTAPSSGTIAGAAPTGHTVSMSNSAGLTVTHAQVTSSLSGNPMHQMTFSGAHTVTGSSAGPTYGHFSRIILGMASGATTALQAGDTIEGLMAFEIDAGAQGFAFPTLEMRWGGSANYHRDLHSAARELPSEAISGVLRTPAKILTGTPLVGDVMLIAYAMLKSYPDGAVTDGATIRFGRAVLQKVG